MPIEIKEYVGFKPKKDGEAKPNKTDKPVKKEVKKDSKKK